MRGSSCWIMGGAEIIGESYRMGAVAAGGGPQLLPTQGTAGKEPGANIPVSISSYPLVHRQGRPLAKPDRNQRARKRNW